MIDLFKKMIRRAVPGFPDFHVTRQGEVTAINDAPAAEAATDRFRPRWAVNVRLLTAQGEPDQSAPILEALPLPASPVLCFPKVGERVRVAFDYGSPAHPYIVGQINEGRAMPALAPGEALLPLGDGAFLKADGKGNITLQTDGALHLDAGTITVTADDLVETLGAINRTVEGDVVEEIGGRLARTILGALVELVAGDVRRTILGGEESMVGGDRSELVVGALQILAGLDIEIKTTLGDMLIDSATGTTTVKGAVKTVIDGLLVDLALGATDAVIFGNLFKAVYDAHTHADPASGNTGPPLVPMAANLLSTKVKAG